MSERYSTKGYGCHIRENLSHFFIVAFLWRRKMLSPAGPSSICTHFIACILVGAQCTFQGTWEMGMVTKSDVDSMEQGRGEERREEVFTLEEGYCTDRRWRERERGLVGRWGRLRSVRFTSSNSFRSRPQKVGATEERRLSSAILSPHSTEMANKV